MIFGAKIVADGCIPPDEWTKYPSCDKMNRIGTKGVRAIMVMTYVYKICEPDSLAPGISIRS